MNPSEIKATILQVNGVLLAEEIKSLKELLRCAARAFRYVLIVLYAKKIIKKMQQIFAKTLKIRIFALRKVGNVR